MRSAGLLIAEVDALAGHRPAGGLARRPGRGTGPAVAAVAAAGRVLRAAAPAAGRGDPAYARPGGPRPPSITGGGSGIGAACAARLAAEGAAVAVADRRGAAAAGGGRRRSPRPAAGRSPSAATSRSDDQVARLVAQCARELGAPRLLVNSAGIALGEGGVTGCRAGRLRHGPGGEPARHLPQPPGTPAAHHRGGRRRGGQPVVGLRVPGPARRVRLRRQQGRDREPDPADVAGLTRPRRAGQLRLPVRL